MRANINKSSASKPKPSQSQSPLHKKKIFKFVNDNANSKNERSMQEQTVQDRFIKEPPKETKPDFRVEIERRFNRAITNQEYRFPLHDASSDSLSESSQESLNRLDHICTYDLHSQNLRFFAKQQRANKKSASESRNESKENHPNRDHQRGNINGSAMQSQRYEPIKKVQKQPNTEETRCKTSPDSRRVLHVLDENLKQTSKEQSATKKVPVSTEKRPISAIRLKKATDDKCNEVVSETVDLGSAARKIPVNSSPKQIKFSLNVFATVGDAKSNLSSTKNANQQHTLRDSKAMSKSMKDLTAALRSPLMREVEKVQSPSSSKKTVAVASPAKAISSKILTRCVKTANGQNNASSKDSLLVKPAGDISNFLSEKSPAKIQATEPEKYFSVKSTTDSKASDSRSFVSVVNTEDPASSRGQSKEKLKMTTFLYNKAQSDLLKKQKLNVAGSSNTANIELPQGGTTINIKSFLQGSFTTTNRDKISKTPIRSIISPRTNGNTLSTSNSNTSLYLKKPDLKSSFVKPNGSNLRPTQGSQADSKPRALVQRSMEKSLIQKYVSAEIQRDKTPKQVNGSIGSVPKTPTSRPGCCTRAIESAKFKLDLKTVQPKIGAMSERNKEESRARGAKKVPTEW